MVLGRRIGTGVWEHLEAFERAASVALDSRSRYMLAYTNTYANRMELDKRHTTKAHPAPAQNTVTRYRCQISTCC